MITSPTTYRREKDDEITALGLPLSKSLLVASNGLEAQAVLVSAFSDGEAPPLVYDSNVLSLTFLKK